MLGRMDVLEGTSPRSQIRHRLLGGVRAVVVQHDTNDGLAGIVLIEPIGQRDELNAAMATVTHQGKVRSMIIGEAFNHKRWMEFFASLDKEAGQKYP